MNRQGDKPSRGLPASMDGGLLLAAQIAWLAWASLILVLTAWGLVRAYQNPLLVEMPPLTDLFIELGLDFRLMISVALTVPFVVAAAVSLFLFAKRSRDPMAQLFAAALLTTYALSSRALVALEGLPVVGVSADVVFAAGTLLAMLLFGLFPSGRFEPRWAAALAPLMCLGLIMNPAMGAQAMTTLEGNVDLAWQGQTAMVLYVLLLSSGLIAQFLRYRQVSTKVERQQAKMVVAPLGLWLVALSASLVLLALGYGEEGYWIGWIIFATIPIGIATPFAVAAAVLRYRLFEVDRLISRTITYAIVVAVLGFGYALAVTWTSTLFDSQSSLAVAAATLAVAFLFNPLRKRVQTMVDRRFNRSAYDAERVGRAFSAKLEQALTTEQIVSEWRITVDSSFQPEFSGVWIKATDS